MLEAANPPHCTFDGLSQAVIVRGEGLVATSGQVSSDEHGNFIDGSFEAQVEGAFAALERVLTAAGSNLRSVIRLTYYISAYSPEQIAVIKRIRAPLLSKGCPPASVLIPVVRLYDERALIEIEALAQTPA